MPWALFGAVPIEEVQAGTLVWSRDAATDEWGLKEVRRTFERDYVGNLVTVSAGGEAIEATDGHPFWVIAGEALPDRPPALDAGFDAAGSSGDTNFIYSVDGGEGG